MDPTSIIHKCKKSLIIYHNFKHRSIRSLSVPLGELTSVKHVFAAENERVVAPTSGRVVFVAQEPRFARIQPVTP